MSNQMKISADNQLMDNFLSGAKKAINKQKPFHAVQSENNRAILYSIGENNQFYATYEQENSRTGWVPQNVSSSISEKLFSGESVIVETFDVNQGSKEIESDSGLSVKSRDVSNTTLALAVNHQKTNHLVVGELITKEGNADYQWRKIPFNLGQDTPELSSVKMEQINGEQKIVVDAKGKGDNVDRYIVSPNNEEPWSTYNLGLDFDNRQKIEVLLGENYFGEKVIFTLGTNAGKKIISMKEIDSSEAAITTFDLPEGHTPTCIALSELESSRGSGESGHDLFVFSDKGTLFQMKSEDLVGGGQFKQLYQDKDFLSAPQKMNIELTAKEATFWIHTQSDEVIYLSAPLPSLLNDNEESNTNDHHQGWELSAPVASAVTHLSGHLEYGDSGKVFFFPSRGAKLLRRHLPDKDAGWDLQDILLPAVEKGQVNKIKSNTWQLTVSDKNGELQGDTTVYLRSEHRTELFVNQNYQVLDENWKTFKTDYAGVLSIVESAEGFGGTNIYWKESASSTETKLDPNKKGIEKLLALEKDGQMKSNPMVYNEKGVSMGKLITKDKKDEKKKMIGTSLNMLRKVYEAQSEKVVNDFYPENEEWEAVASFDEEFKPISLGTSSYITSDVIGNTPFTSFANGARWLSNFIQKKAKAFISWIKTKVGEAYAIVVRWGKRVIKFIVQTAKEIVEVSKQLLKLVGTAAEKVWNFIKFLFNWEDIKKTKKVIEACVINSFEGQKNLIKGFGEVQKELISDLKDKVLEWKKQPRKRTGEKQIPVDQSSQKAGASPEANLLSNHLKGNLNSEGDTTDSVGVQFDDTLEMAPNFASELQSAFDDINFEQPDFPKDLANKLMSLPGQLAKGKFSMDDLVDALLDLVCYLIDCASSTIEFLVNLVVKVLDKLLKFLKKKIYIPVVSELLEDYLGIKSFSILDVMCYAMAIPGTVMYKIFTGKAPFQGESWNQYISDTAQIELDNSISSGSLPVYPSNYTGYAFDRKPEVNLLVKRIPLPKMELTMKEAQELFTVTSIGSSILKCVLDFFEIPLLIAREKAKKKVLKPLGRLISASRIIGGVLDFSRSSYFPFIHENVFIDEFLKIHKISRALSLVFKFGMLGLDLITDDKESWKIQKAKILGDGIVAGLGIPARVLHVGGTIANPKSRKTIINSFGIGVQGVCRDLYAIERCLLINGKGPAMFKPMMITSGIGLIGSLVDQVSFANLPAEDFHVIE